MSARTVLKTVAKVQADAAPRSVPGNGSPGHGSIDALQLELKRRIEAKAEQKPAGSIREALSRWLDEEM
ncbi:MAG: hypothetical protein ACJ790_13540 [Myxococcaceae bacterium]